MTYIIQVTKPALWNKKIESAQRTFKRYVLSVSEFSPLWHSNTSMKAGQDSIAVVPFCSRTDCMSKFIRVSDRWKDKQTFVPDNPLSRAPLSCVV